MLLLAGCDVTKPLDFKVKCSDQQLDLVEKQLRICNKTSLSAQYCLAVARIEQCDHIELDIKGS